MLKFSKVKNLVSKQQFWTKKTPKLFEKKYGHSCLTYLPSKNLSKFFSWKKYGVNRPYLPMIWHMSKISQFFFEGLPNEKLLKSSITKVNLQMSGFLGNKIVYVHHKSLQTRVSEKSRIVHMCNSYLLLHWNLFNVFVV